MIKQEREIDKLRKMERFFMKGAYLFIVLSALAFVISYQSSPQDPITFSLTILAIFWSILALFALINRESIQKKLKKMGDRKK